MERNRAATTVMSYGLDTALHGAARYQIYIEGAQSRYFELFWPRTKVFLN